LKSAISTSLRTTVFVGLMVFNDMIVLIFYILVNTFRLVSRQGSYFQLTNRDMPTKIFLRYKNQAHTETCFPIDKYV